MAPTAGKRCPHFHQFTGKSPQRTRPSVPTTLPGRRPCVRNRLAHGVSPGRADCQPTEDNLRRQLSCPGATPLRRTATGTPARSATRTGTVPFCADKATCHNADLRVKPYGKFFQKPSPPHRLGPWPPATGARVSQAPASHAHDASAARPRTWDGPPRLQDSLRQGRGEAPPPARTLCGR
jgi:hypothetical protein